MATIIRARARFGIPLTLEEQKARLPWNRKRNLAVAQSTEQGNLLRACETEGKSLQEIKELSPNVDAARNHYVKAMCLKVEYEGGFLLLNQGAKAGELEGWESERGGFYRRPHHHGGWAEEIYPSNLILTCKIEGTEGEVSEDLNIRIKSFFSHNLGRLTQKRQKAIIGTMPDTVRVKQEVSIKGNPYYRVHDSDLAEWLKLVNIALKKR